MSRYLSNYISSLLVVISAQGISVAQPTGPQEHVPLTLVQIIGRSDAAVHVRVSDGSGKYAIIEVLEILTGADPGKRLRIDFRELTSA